MSFAITGTILTVGGSAYAANRSAAAGRASARGADNATAESARQYDQTRADLASGRSLYEGANALLGQLYGIPVQSSDQFRDEQPVLIGDTELPAGTTTRPVPSGARGWYEVWHGDQRIGTLRPGGSNGQFINDTGFDIQGAMSARRAQSPAGGGAPTLGTPSMAGFFASPDYNFRRSEGNRGIEQSFAARGGGQSGNALRALAEFSSNLASGEFGNHFNRLTTLAGLGSAATSDTASFGARHAENAGRNALIAGDARASSIADRANILGQGISDIAGMWGYFGSPFKKKNQLEEISMYSLPRRI